MKLGSWNNYSCSTILCTESNKQSLRRGQKDKYKQCSGLQHLYITWPLLISQTHVSFQTFLAHSFHSMKCYYYVYIPYIYMFWQSERIAPPPPRIKYYIQVEYCHFHENWIIMVCLGNHEDIQTIKIRCTFCSIYKKGHCLYIFRNYIQGMPHPAFWSSSQEIWVSEYLDC